MNISKNTYLNILDLPNEILLIIFNKLKQVDVLYSLVDVTQRFDRLVLDPLYIRNLDIISMTIKSYYDPIYSIDYQVLSRICKNVLRRIHHQINELIVEQYSMEHILHMINYPQLNSLSLVDFQDEVLLNSLIGKLFYFLYFNYHNRNVIRHKFNRFLFFDCELKIIQLFGSFSLNKLHVLKSILTIKQHRFHVLELCRLFLL